MKLFQNPIVVGLLAIVAVGVVVHALWPVIGPAVMPHVVSSATAVPGQASAATQPAPAARPTPATQPVPAVQHVPAIAAVAAAAGDLEPLLLQTNSPRWAGSPRRDPFLLANPGSVSTTSAPPWKVNGIWRQNGVALAAINQGVYRPGDVLEGYTIVAINDNEVSLEKDGQKTSVSFGFGHPAPAPAPGSK